MKIIKLLLLAITAIFSSSYAEPTLTQLYRGDKQITLFGTIHIAKPEYYPLSDKLMSVFNAADALVVELNTTHPTTKEQMMKFIISNGVYKKSPSIIGKERLKNIATLVESDITEISHMKPWLIYISSIAYLYNKYEFIEIGVDEFLIRKADTQDKPIIPLETVQEQLTILDELPDNESLLFIDSLLDSKRLQSDMQLLDNFWFNNDINAGDEILNIMKSEIPVFYQRGLINRNKIMAERIIENNKKHRTLFVAIGAAHLHGKNSVIQQLLQKGYRVKK